MAQAKRKTAEKQDLGTICTDIMSTVVGVYVCLMLCIFPIFAHDKYFDILNDKYYFFWIGTAITTGIVLILALIGAFVDAREFHGIHIKRFFGCLRPSQIGKYLSVPDRFFLFFMVVSIISTAASNWPYEAFWGNNGRLQGLFLWLWFAAAYVLVTRFFRLKRWQLDAYLLFGLIVSIWGILDYFGVNPMGWRASMGDTGQRWIFSSTIGNVNTLTAVIALYLGVSCTLLVAEGNPLLASGKAMPKSASAPASSKAACAETSCSLFGATDTAQTNRKMLISRLRFGFYLFSTFISFMAIAAGQSDNAVLAVAAILALLPFYAWRNRRGVLRYLLVLACCFLSLALLGFITHGVQATVIMTPEAGWGVLLNLANGKTTWMLAAGLLTLLLAAALYAVFWRSCHQGGAAAGPSRGSLASGALAVSSFAGPAGGADTDTTQNSLAFFLSRRISKLPRLLWLALGILALLGLIWVFYDANHGGHPEWYAPYANLLYFNDAWGTHRGYNWSLVMRHMRDFPLFNQLFGTGPETYGIFTGKYDYYDMLAHFDEIYDSPHNEFLQYLFCTGILGFVGYYGFVLSSCLKMLGIRGHLRLSVKAGKKELGLVRLNASKLGSDRAVEQAIRVESIRIEECKAEPGRTALDSMGKTGAGLTQQEGTVGNQKALTLADSLQSEQNLAAAAACAFAVIAYTAQSFVNVSAPLVVPTVILFLAIGGSVVRRQAHYGNETEHREK